MSLPENILWGNFFHGHLDEKWPSMLIFGIFCVIIFGYNLSWSLCRKSFRQNLGSSIFLQYRDNTSLKNIKTEREKSFPVAIQAEFLTIFYGVFLWLWLNQINKFMHHIIDYLLSLSWALKDNQMKCYRSLSTKLFSLFLDKITYMYKRPYNTLYKIWRHKLYSLKSNVNVFLIIASAKKLFFGIWIKK